MTVSINAFDVADWDAVCQVYEPAAIQEIALSGAPAETFRPLPEEEDLDRFVHVNVALVALVDTRVVGFVAWRDRGEWRGSGYLSWLYVDPEFHRRGIGNQLMTEAMAALGPQAWTLVRLGNDPAINLYKGHGMEIVLSRPPELTGYPHTELRMALPTSPKFDPNVPNFGTPAPRKPEAQ